MTDEKRRRRQRSHSPFQDDPEARTFFGEQDPLNDFEEELDSVISPELQAELNTELLFGDTDKIVADAEAFSERIKRRKSRRDGDSTFESEADTFRGSKRQRRRTPQGKKYASGTKAMAKKEKSTNDAYSSELTERSTRSGTTRRGYDEMAKVEQVPHTTTSEATTVAESTARATGDDSAKPPESTKASSSWTGGERQSAAAQHESVTAIPTGESATRKGSKERAARRKNNRTRGSGGGTGQGFNVTDLAKMLLDVLTAEQQESVQARPQPQQQPPCEACIAAQESGSRRAEAERTGSRCETCGNDDRRLATPGGRHLSRPLRGRRRGVYYDDEVDEEEEGYDEETFTRRKPRKVFSQSMRGSRGKGRHLSQRPVAVEETASTKVVETREQRQSPYTPWEPRFGYPPEDCDYDAGYGPFDLCGHELYYPLPDDAFLDYIGEPLDPWWRQGYRYWCGPCVAGVPAECPVPCVEQCPCIAAAETSPTQGTIVRREEVWTEGGRHRHRVQEILEGGAPSPSGPDARMERFQEAPSGFLRDGLAPTAAGSQASTRIGADQPPATGGGGRIVLDAYEEIRPPGCPPSQPLFSQAAAPQSAVSATFSKASSHAFQAGKTKSQSAVPHGRVLYWEEDTTPLRIYAPSEPAVATEHKMRFKKNHLEGTSTARRASTVELGNLLRSRRDAPSSLAFNWQPAGGRTKAPQWIQRTSACPDAAGQWHRTCIDMEGGSGTYFLDMTWSTNRANAGYETFTWSSKKTADKRLSRTSIAVSDRKQKHRTKPFANEKKISRSVSRTSTHSKAQKGITTKVSSTTSQKASSMAPRMVSSETKTTVSLEPSCELSSPLVAQAQASRISTASGRRLPGKSKAATLLLQQKAAVPQTSRDAIKAPQAKTATELSSPLHSDTSTISIQSDFFSKGSSRKVSAATAKVDAKSPEYATNVGSPEKLESRRSSRRQSEPRGSLPSMYELFTQKDRKASTASTRRYSTAKEAAAAEKSGEAKTLQERKSIDSTAARLDEKTERANKAEGETTRIDKPKVEAESKTSESGASKKESAAMAAEHSETDTTPSAAGRIQDESKSLAGSKTSMASKAITQGPNATSAEVSSINEEQLSEAADEPPPKGLQGLPPPAEVSAEEPDTESKQDMDAILKELEKQTTVMYPESNLVVVIGILCIVWICVIAFLTHPKYGPKRPGWPNPTFPTWPPHYPGTKGPSVVPRSQVYICSTDFCIKEGEHVGGLFSRDVSPCDNFYQYVCRHWERMMHNPAMGIGVATSVDTMLQDAMHTKVLEYILDSSHDDVTEAKRLYDACISAHGEASTTELRHMFATWPPQGRWPVDSAASVSEFDVWSVAARLTRDLGIGALLGVQAALDKTFGKHVLELELPQPLFFRGDDQQNAIISMFTGAITESAQLVQNSGMINELMSDVMAVFKRIAKRRPVFPGLEVRLAPLESLPQGIRTFLTVVFEGILASNTTVQYRNPVYFEDEISALFSEIGPRAIINYLGFRLVVRMAPFLPDSTNLLRLHSIESTGRVLSPTPKRVLCLRVVASVLPVCVVKAHARLTIASGSDLTSRAWLSELESLFFRSSRRYVWMDSATHRVARFVLRRLRLARFYPQWSLKRDNCAGNMLTATGGPIHMWHEASRVYQSQRLAQFTRRTRPRDVGDAFGTLARFNPGHQAVYVPFGIVNTSVPGNGTVFAFELSRMATRLYAALVPVLFEDGAADESALLRFTDHAVRTLDGLLDCLVRDYRNMPLALHAAGDEGVVDPDRARYALLAHTAAVVLAHAAFKELLHVKRIWKFDFRFAPLPDLTSEQLFFAYFARDNCECSDEAHKAHSYVIDGRMPPEQRVNFALRHLPSFGEAFRCARDAPMRPLDGAVCRVFESDRPL
ncbi:mucin-19-like isoform X2 [Dermacentor albipictus]|uniref:mucin-19-like isoform X2 n=1 Tax=Dermacentor albipictus TaxID=60249 RepID=UPI0038FD3524